MNDCLDNNDIKEKEIRKTTYIGLFVNIVLTILKITIGLFSSSSSVVADGIHSLSDCSTDIAVLIGVKYWNRPPDEDHPYGHRRIETMITVSIGLVLGLAGLTLVYEAVSKIHNGTYTVPGWSALIIALISIFVKEFLFRYTMKKAIQLKSSAMKANAWHHRSDSISSIPVALAVSITQYDASWALLDPIASIAVSFFILQAAFSISWPSLRQLSDLGANKKSIKSIEEIALNVEGVQSVHCVRTRFYGSALYIDLHLMVDPDITVEQGHSIAGHVKHHLLTDGPDIVDVLIHVEPGKRVNREQ